jgi:hypothetical protein
MLDICYLCGREIRIDDDMAISVTLDDGRVMEWACGTCHMDRMCPTCFGFLDHSPTCHQHEIDAAWEGHDDSRHTLGS